MKTVAFIPARYDSQRFPGKPLALIAGNPMIQHVYQHAVQCPEVAEVFVATDDERIFQCVQGFGGKAVMTKKNHASGTDRIAEATRRLGLSKSDLIINIQGDQPFFDPSTITQLITPLMQSPDILMGTLKYKITDERVVNNPNHVKVVTDKDGFALFFSRSPLPFFRDPKSTKTYYKHLGFYAYRNEFLQKFAGYPMGQLESAEKLEQLRALENGCRILVVESAQDSMEVDTAEDIGRVEKMIARSKMKRE